VAFRMARLYKRKKSGSWGSRKAIPVDVREEYCALYDKSLEEIFYAPATDPRPVAEMKHRGWLIEIENRIRTLRSKKRGEARDLTHREAQALTGEWYHWFVARHEANPGEPERWRLNSELIADAVMSATPEWDIRDPLIDQAQRGKEPVVREVHPLVADEGKTAQFLVARVTRTEGTVCSA
jgi:hypothetical protein